jgi:hypothetical protein
MQALDTSGKMGQYLLDEKRKISQTHLYNICKYKQGKNTCRYISLTIQGYVCVKKTPMKKMLDDRVKSEKMKAIGDNCEGLGKFSV